MFELGGSLSHQLVFPFRVFRSLFTVRIAQLLAIPQEVTRLMIVKKSGPEPKRRCFDNSLNVEVCSDRR
jgi:hypothetical protein